MNYTCLLNLSRKNFEILYSVEVQYLKRYLKMIIEKGLSVKIVDLFIIKIQTSCRNVALLWRQNSFMQRAIEPRKGLWTLPAGFLEMGETLQEGALRETKEETN